MEAALMQVYAPRDPVAEAIRGEISVRQLRVMVQHLPAGSAYERATRGPWTDSERLQLATESRLRDVLAQLTYLAGAFKSAYRVSGSPSDATYLQEPLVMSEDQGAVDTESRALEAAELDALMHRA